jgi:uncharacterized protein
MEDQGRKKLVSGIMFTVLGTALVLVLVFFQGDAHMKGKKATSNALKAEVIGAMPESNENLPISGTITTASGATIQVRVAETQKQRGIGLSNLEMLPKDQGMLFLFEKTGLYQFWMKDMNFPIDIIWLRAAAEGYYGVVHVASDVSPDSYPNLIDPKTDADAVLEVSAGVAKELGILPGTVIQIKR